MTQASPDTLDDAIGEIVDRVPILTDVLDIEGLNRRRFCDDMAGGIFSNEDIARRYGLNGLAGLFGFLRAHPEVVDEIKRQKAIRQSDAGVKETAQLRSAHAYNDRVHHIGGMIGDPTVGKKEQLEAAKLLANAGGITSTGASKDSGGANIGQQLVFNIIRPSGEQRKTITTVVDAEAVPDLAMIDDDAGLEEDV